MMISDFWPNVIAEVSNDTLKTWKYEKVKGKPLSWKNIYFFKKFLFCFNFLPQKHTKYRKQAIDLECK